MDSFYEGSPERDEMASFSEGSPESDEMAVEDNDSSSSLHAAEAGQLPQSVEADLPDMDSSSLPTVDDEMLSKSLDAVEASQLPKSHDTIQQLEDLKSAPLQELTAMKAFKEQLKKDHAAR